MNASTPVGQAGDTFILFKVADTTYALPSRDVQHMEMFEQVTRVPNAPPFVDGVVFSRGEVVPAVNMRVRFGFERVPTDLRTRLIVLHSAGRSVGLVVDEAREFVRIPADAVQARQDALPAGGDYVQGVASVNGRLIVVLALEPLLNFTAAAPAA
jgi:purine-binding chemotaxis protein CheW